MIRILSPATALPPVSFDTRPRRVSKGPAPLCSFGPPVRQRLDRRVVAADQGFLLGAAPALQLTLGRDRVRDALKFLCEHQRHGATLGRIPAEVTRIVLSDALL